MHLYVVKHNPKTFVVGEKTVILYPGIVVAVPGFFIQNLPIKTKRL